MRLDHRLLKAVTRLPSGRGWRHSITTAPSQKSSSITDFVGATQRRQHQIWILPINYSIIKYCHNFSSFIITKPWPYSRPGQKENKQKWLFWPTSYIVSENNQTSLTHANNVTNSRFVIAYFKSYISLRKLGCICMTNKVLCSKFVTWPKACFEYWNFRQNHWFFFGWKHVKFFFQIVG